MVLLRGNADAPKGLKVGDYSAVFGVSADLITDFTRIRSAGNLISLVNC